MLWCKGLVFRLCCARQQRSGVAAARHALTTETHVQVHSGNSATANNVVPTCTALRPGCLEPSGGWSGSHCSTTSLLLQAPFSTVPARVEMEAASKRWKKVRRT
jgi:hypothetical protein